MSLTKVNTEMVTYEPPYTGAVTSGYTLEKKLSQTVSVKDFGATGDGTTNDAPAFQKAADDCETNEATYIFIPNYSGDYYINQAVTVTSPGVRIFGEAGATYDRGNGKGGNILVGSGAAYAFDLGANRTTGNPADNWTVSNVKFKQAAGVTAQTKYGIAFTSQTNGPDRGAVVRECSATGMAAGVYVPDLSVATRLANLIVENCCFSNNNYSVYAPNANIFGARFVGNQMEQNTSGAIHGAFNGPVYIADNMLEGQINPINITVPSITGNRPTAVVERNYFEANSGDYIVNYNCNTAGSLIVRDNFNYASTTSDFVRVNSGFVYLDINNNAFPDSSHVTFNDGVPTIAYGSRFLDNVSYYRVRKVNVGTNRSANVIISDYQNLIDTKAENTHVSFISGTQYQTPYGLKYCVSGANFVDIPLSVTAGDMITLNILCAQYDDTPIVQLWNATTTTVLWDGTATGLQLKGRWALVSITGICPSSSASVRFRFFNAGAASVIAGVAARNYGAHVNDGTAVKSIYPVVPNV